MLLEPTSPFTTTYDVDEAIRELENKSRFYKSLVSVSKVEVSHPDFYYRLNKNNAITSYISKIKNHNQDDRIYQNYFFVMVAYIYHVFPRSKNINHFFHDQTLAKIMPKWKSIEIDDYLDYVHALATIKNISKIRKYEEK